MKSKRSGNQKNLVSYRYLARYLLRPVSTNRRRNLHTLERQHPSSPSFQHDPANAEPPPRRVYHQAQRSQVLLDPVHREEVHTLRHEVHGSEEFGPDLVVCLKNYTNQLVR